MLSKFQTQDSHLTLVNPEVNNVQGYELAKVKMTPNDWVKLIIHAKASLKSLHDADYNYGDEEIFTDRMSWE